MGQAILVYVLIVITSHHGTLYKEHVAVFGSEDHCQIERRAVEGYTLHNGTYFCQKELLK